MNPWKIIGWIVLVLLLMSLYRCYEVFRPRSGEEVQQAQVRAEQARPRHEFTIDSFTCEQVYTTTRVKVSGRNTGATTIEFAEIFFMVGDESLSPFFNPHDIPAGSIATAKHIARRHGDCRIVGMQDRHGNPVTLLD